MSIIASQNEVSEKGIAYLCSHEEHGLNDYLDLGLVLWPEEKGHFGIVRYGTEVLVFNINDFMSSGKIEKDKVLWYKEFAEPSSAYYQTIDIFRDLYLTLKNDKYNPVIVFPSIYGNLDDCDFIKLKKTMGLVRDCYQAYAEGIAEGCATVSKFFKGFDNDEH